jgi:signal transduction histidine kinase
MMGLTFLAKRLPPDDKTAAQVVGDMRDAIERADSITRGLLDFSAHSQLNLAPEDLNRLIEETLRLVRHEVGKNRLQVVREYGADLPPVAADKTRLQQVFVNLIFNAVHAMPQGGTLTLRTYTRQASETSHFEGSRKAASLWVGDPVVVAEVDDSGCGIPEEHLVRIFDPFFTTKPTGEGTGLGLPVSKKIIELHGGILSVKNRREGGVRASVLLKPHRPEA